MDFWGIKISKEEILKHSPTNKREKEALEKISVMSDEEIKKQTFEFLHGNDYKIHLTNTGHSKGIFKIDRLAKGLFEVQWLFLIAPSDTTFATSDNPCFTLSPTKIRNGLLSPNVIVFFPLRPDLCIAIKPKIKSKTEHFLKLDRRKVKEINQLILANSYECFVAKDKKQLFLPAPPERLGSSDCPKIVIPNEVRNPLYVKMACLSDFSLRSK